MIPTEQDVLLDVRTPSEFREAHIPGSVNVPLGDLPKACGELTQRLDGKRVTVICRTGRRAEEALALLCAGGLDLVEVLPGGVEAWQAAGRELNRGAKAISIERQVRIAAGFLIVLGVVLGFAVGQPFFLLSGFVGAGLAFAGITDTCAMGLVFARMPWNRGSADTSACPNPTAPATSGSGPGEKAA